MKAKLYTTALLVLLSITICAQNWQPIMVGNKYNYKLNNAEIITNTILVDSTKIVEGDSVYYLNRIMTPCDTCNGEGWETFALRNQPQFLMRQMVKTESGSYTFSDTISFTINPHLYLGSVWLFDEVNSIEAEVTEKTEEMIFGTPDSVKTISLSNGKTIKISKNHGIILFPQGDNTYYLAGIEGKINEGINLPSFWDFFNYDVGDVFQRNELFWNSGEGFFETLRTYKYTINSKEVENNKVTYTVSGWKLISTNDYPLDGSPVNNQVTYPFTKTLVYTDSVNHFTNTYPNQVINIHEHQPESFVFHDSWLNKVEFFVENGLYVKKAGAFLEDGDTGIPCFFEANNIFPNYHPDILLNWGPEGVSIKYVQSQGLNFKLFNFEYGYEDYFVGKISNGVTTGTVNSDEYFLQFVSTESQTVKKPQVYPNPLKVGQTLKIAGEIEVDSYSLFNLQGQVVKSGKMSNSSIELNQVSRGVYIIELKSKGKSFFERIVIQ